MRWTPGGDSQDIEDRRDESGGGGGGFQFGGMHIGIGGALVLLVLSLVFKQNFFALLGGGVPRVPVRRRCTGPIQPRTQRKSRWCNSCRSFWTTPSTPGRNFCRNKRTNRTGTPNLCCFAISRNRVVAERKPLPDRFIVPKTKKSTLISISSMS